MIARVSASVVLMLVAVAPAMAADEESFLQSAETWVAAAFIIFLVGLFRPIKRMLTSTLDGRTDAIKAELDEAQRLREEAQHTLAEYQRKQRDALQEAEGIIAAAREEAERMEKSAAVRTEELLARRQQQALDMIAAAEAQALADVRGLTADVAIEATRQLLAEAMSGDSGDRLVSQAIEDLPSKLN